LLVELFESNDDARTCKRQTSNTLCHEYVYYRNKQQLNIELT